MHSCKSRKTTKTTLDAQNLLHCEWRFKVAQNDDARIVPVGALLIRQSTFSKATTAYAENITEVAVPVVVVSWTVFVPSGETTKTALVVT